MPEWNPPVKMTGTAVLCKTGCAVCGGSGYVVRHVDTVVWRERITFDEYRPCECTKITLNK